MTKTPPATNQRRATLREALLDNNLLVVVVLTLAILLLAIGQKLLDVDTWLTLMAGREVYEHGLPHRETLTVIPAGREWIDQQWLAQLVYYGLDRAGGLGLALVFHTVMVSGAIGITIVASRVRGASARMTLLAAAVSILVAPWSWQLRAQSIALPLFALTLALTATDRSLERRRTLLVFPLLVVWANVHGSVVRGALIVTLAGLLALVGRLRNSRPVPYWRLIAYLLAPSICALASPYGTDLVRYYRLLFVDSPVSRYVTEWQAPRPHGLLLGFFAVAAATIVVAVWQRRRLTTFDLVVLALTLAGALRSVRAVVWFSVAMAMLLPLALDGIVGPPSAARVHRRLAAILMGGFAFVLAATAAFTLTRGDAWFERGWPNAKARAAIRRVTTNGTEPVWASGKYADWLLWKEPSLRGRLAWDARYELLTAPEVRAIVRFNGHKPGWQQALRPYPILVIDRKRHAAQARALVRRGAHVIYSDASVVVLARTR